MRRATRSFVIAGLMVTAASLSVIPSMKATAQASSLHSGSCWMPTVKMDCDWEASGNYVVIQLDSWAAREEVHCELDARSYRIDPIAFEVPPMTTRKVVIERDPGFGQAYEIECSSGTGASDSDWFFVYSD